MAWCPHCNQDRPITRQTFEGRCPICGGEQITIEEPHKNCCRGPVRGAFDVCSFCNTPIFAKAITKEDYDKFEAQEKAEIEKCNEERIRLEKERAAREAQRETQLEKEFAWRNVKAKKEMAELVAGCVAILVAGFIVIGVIFAINRSITGTLVFIICSIICVLSLIPLYKMRKRLKAELVNLLDQTQ